MEKYGNIPDLSKMYQSLEWCCPFALVMPHFPDSLVPPWWLLLDVSCWLLPCRVLSLDLFAVHPAFSLYSLSWLRFMNFSNSYFQPDLWTLDQTSSCHGTRPLTQTFSLIYSNHSFVTPTFCKPLFLLGHAWFQTSWEPLWACENGTSNHNYLIGLLWGWHKIVCTKHTALGTWWC